MLVTQKSENTMAAETATNVANRPTTHPLTALGMVLLIIVVEYIARHFVLFWFPVIGALRVNDMLVAGLAYLGLVTMTVPPERRTFAALTETIRAILTEARHWSVWLAAVAAFGAGMLALVDQWLWGSLTLPSVASPWRWEQVVFASAAPLLVSVSLLLMNGWVIPFAEEWLWRGKVQPQLIGTSGQVAGVLVSSVLFSLKHAIVDASLARLLALSAFGLVLGVLALRRGWRAAALAHALANTVATTLALLTGQV
jgi:membrane protease YdiL (CAAX protease family)